MSDARLEQIILRRAAVAAVLLPVALSTIQGRQVVEKWARNHRPRPLRIVSGELLKSLQSARSLVLLISRNIAAGRLDIQYGRAERLGGLQDPSQQSELQAEGSGDASGGLCSQASELHVIEETVLANH